ncbi:MAG: Bax inhibitor-1/YccA family protein [Bacteroidales bacterium]|nr:Bax inhibitor-1/YccA family protein [Bacteroidales bacterium]
MFNDFNNQTPPAYYSQADVARQTNAVLKRVYVRMFIGLLVSAFCALGVASSPAAITFIFGNSIIFWGMFIALFAMAILIPTRMHKMSSSTVLLLFIVYAALMGVFLSSIFMVYRISAIVSTFFISAGTFGAMSVYGYFTKTDLTKMGSFLYMALFGLLIAMLVNLFLKSAAMDYVVSIIGVLIFIGLTAWDTQQVKRLAAANLDPALADKLATMGAMDLYLDFINLFLFLLRIFGGNRD